MKRQLKEWASGRVAVTRWVLLAVCLLLLLDGRAWAATNLAWSCADASRAGQGGDACGQSSWNTSGLILACSTDACSWGAATWRDRATVPATRQTLVCTLDVAVGSVAACGANYSGERWQPLAGAQPVPEPEPPVVPPPGPAPTGMVRLTWVAPTQYTDGTPLTGLTGYRISFGLSTLTQTIDVGPAVTAYDITGLAVGTWQLGVQAMAGGVLSAMSNIATKTIVADAPPPPVDPCVADPLTITNVAWPSAQTGRRSLGYNTGTKTLASLVFTSPNRIVFTDSRGCVATVTR